MIFALAGNQNCGKTTMFNQLTGSNQHVGNFPGVTVDRKDGQILSLKNISEPTRRTPTSDAVFCLKNNAQRGPVDGRV